MSCSESIGGAMRHVAAFVFFAGRPRSLFRFDLHRAAGHVDAPGNGIEYEELGLGPEVRGVAKSRRLEIRLGALGERARIAVIALAVRRLDHVAGDVERRLVGERVDPRRVRIGH
jgi:hypothetical protein